MDLGTLKYMVAINYKKQKKAEKGEKGEKENIFPGRQSILSKTLENFVNGLDCKGENAWLGGIFMGPELYESWGVHPSKCLTLRIRKASS